MVRFFHSYKVLLMKLKEWMIQAFLFVTLVALFQYLIGLYFNPRTPEKTELSGQSFVAPEMQKSYKPLNFDRIVDPVGQIEPAQLHTITTDLGIYTFSSQGAILQSLQLFWQNKTMQIELLTTNTPCFFVALDGTSPLAYTYEGQSLVHDGRATALTYKTTMQDVNIVKTFVVYHDSYQIDVAVRLVLAGEKNENAQAFRMFLPMPIAFEAGKALPFGGASRDLRGITNKAASSCNSVVLRTIALCGQSQEFIFEPKIFGFSDKFMVNTFVQKDNQKPTRAYFKQIDTKQYEAILESESCTKELQQNWSFYLGPKVENSLQLVDPALLQTIDYGWVSFLAKPMAALLNWFKERLGNYGIAIILLTLLLNLLLMPFRLSGEKSMRQQADFQKKLTYIRQKYKHDKEALDAASAELIQKHGMPGFMGCLPLLLNIPFFIALNYVLSYSFELHGAHFLWITDLTAKDPYYILGILTGVFMLLTPAQGDAKQLAMRYGTALVFAAITMTVSSGLALFILINTLTSLLQALVMRLFKRNKLSIA